MSYVAQKINHMTRNGIAVAPNTVGACPKWLFDERTSREKAAAARIERRATKNLRDIEFGYRSRTGEYVHL